MLNAHRSSLFSGVRRIHQLCSKRACTPVYSCTFHRVESISLHYWSIVADPRRWPALPWTTRSNARSLSRRIRYLRFETSVERANASLSSSNGLFLTEGYDQRRSRMNFARINDQWVLIDPSRSTPAWRFEAISGRGACAAIVKDRRDPLAISERLRASRCPLEQ